MRGAYRVMVSVRNTGMNVTVNGAWWGIVETVKVKGISKSRTLLLKLKRTMAYIVSFTGDRKPEQVADTQGAEIYKDFQEGTMAARIELRHGLIVECRTIKSIEYVPSIEERYTYSRNELDAFERDKLAPFLNERNELPLENKLRFLEKEGLIHFAVVRSPIVTSSDVVLSVVSHMVNEYTKMEERISQWVMYKGKRSYGEKKRVEQLEQTALINSNTIHG